MPDEPSNVLPERLEWTIHARVKSREKALRVFNATARALAVPVELESCEPNSTDQTLYRVDFTSELSARTLAGAVFETLRTAARLAVWWKVNGPEPDEGGTWSFYGLTEPPAVSVSGVAYAGFELIGRPGSGAAR